MAKARANGIEIEYDTFGDESERPLLLVMGLGTQMIAWDEAFCDRLAGRGHFVVRFDNRDIGLSTKIDGADLPPVVELMPKIMQGETVDVPYLLSDMADDAVGLLDALGIDAAHVVGASMGGMIAQSMAIQHGGRVLSLTSIMSNTGARDAVPAKPEAIARLMLPPANEKQQAVENSVATFRVIGSPGFPYDEERVRSRAATAYDRSYHPAGQQRQLAAITMSPPRTEALERLNLPTLVIHGDADPLVPVENGRATHAAVPGSEMLVIEGMGHDLPEGAWPTIVDAIAKLTDRAHPA